MQDADRSYPVHLTQTAPVAISPGELLFYDVVDAKSVSRSSVLSCIAEAGGDASLPHAVNVSQFRAWLTACAASQEYKKLIPFSDLCTVVKVAFFLDDQSLDEWVQLAAECLMPVRKPWGHASHNGPSYNLCSHTAAQHLSSLPDHVRRHILSAVHARDSTCSLDLIQWLPQSLHAAIIDAAIKPPQRSLKASFLPHHHPLPFLDALAALPASPPSIASLHIDFATWHNTDERTSASTASHLAAALSHHSMLSTLQLSMNPTTTEANILAEAISTLSSLQSLHLGDPEAHFPSDAIPALQAALHSLPQLDCLHISLQVKSVLSMLKRQRDAGTPDAPAQPRHCLATLLSSAPGLTSLHICLRGYRPRQRLGDPDGLFPVGADASLQHLRHLALRVDDCTAAARLLHILRTSPLTSLAFEQSVPWQAEDVAERTDVARSMYAFPQLRKLYLASVPETWAARALRLVLHTPSTALTALRELSDLRLRVDFWALFKAAPQLSTALPALQHLTILCRCDEGSYESSPEGWSQVLSHLGGLQLQNLDLAVIGNRGNSGPELSALVPLTCMSALRLAGRNLVRAAEDLEALSRMTQLRRLHLNDFTLPPELRPRLVPALLPLRRLTQLVLNAAGMYEAFTAACKAQQLRGAWPELCDLGVQVSRPQSAAELQPLGQSLCALPALRQLMFVCDSYDTSEVEAKLSFDALVSLQEIAAAAGVVMAADGLPDSEDVCMTGSP